MNDHVLENMRGESDAKLIQDFSWSQHERARHTVERAGLRGKARESRSKLLTMHTAIVNHAGKVLQERGYKIVNGTLQTAAGENCYSWNPSGRESCDTCKHANAGDQREYVQALGCQHAGPSEMTRRNNGKLCPFYSER